jgi:hypothetical protein
MRKLIEHINSRNRILPTELLQIQSELESIFRSKILSAGVTQPGYFNDFYPILDNYKRSGVISRYMITEEEYTNDGDFYKIPVIDVTRVGQQSNSRIFLSPA